MEKRKGFTVLELLVVVTVGAILTTIAFRGVAGLQTRSAVHQARNIYVTMHARARAQAVEYGERVRLRIDPVGDSIWISRGATVLDVVRLGREMGVDIQGGTSVHTICMNARGFADESCNSFSSPLTLTFAQGGATTTVEVLPLGQVLY